MAMASPAALLLHLSMTMSCDYFQWRQVVLFTVYGDHPPDLTWLAYVT
jgi:hypothetical protein